MMNVPKIHELLEGVTSRIHLSRPFGVPATILNPALATPHQRLDNLGQIQVTLRDVWRASDYFRQAIKFTLKNQFVNKRSKE